MTKAEQIRDAYLGLPAGASNRQVAEETERKHGFKPTPQSIYGAIGNEGRREAHRWTGVQVLEAKAAAQHFPSLEAYHECVGMIRRISHTHGPGGS